MSSCKVTEIYNEESEVSSQGCSSDVLIAIPEKPKAAKPKRSSKTYSFSEKDLRKYHLAKKEGRLRFPDVFMYHIHRSTEDVQREARLLKKLQTKTCLQDSEMDQENLLFSNSPISDDHSSFKSNGAGLAQGTKESSLKKDQNNGAFSSSMCLRDRHLTLKLASTLSAGLIGFGSCIALTGSLGISAIASVSCILTSVAAMSVYEVCTERRREKKANMEIMEG